MPEPARLLGHPWFGRVLLLVGATVVALVLFRDQLLGRPVEVVAVRRGDLVQTVVATGRVTTPQRVEIAATVTDRIAAIPVAEGQAVKRGDVLVVLDDRDERAAVEQARAAVAQTEARLRQLAEDELPAARTTLAQAEAHLRHARQKYARSEELLAKGFISQAALDDARRDRDVAESQLQAARLQVDAHATQGSETRLARGALAQAQAALELAAARLEQTVLRAPTDGTLIARAAEPGDVVQPGRTLMALAPAGETQVVVQVDEKNLGQLALGQRAIVSADAYPNERFAAELFYINPGIDALRGSVEVKLRVREPPAYLRQDMTVSVDIATARRDGVLLAPAVCVRDAASAAPWVLRVDDGRAVRQAVTLGVRGQGVVELRNGIDPDTLLVADPGGVTPGQRVRVTRVATVAAAAVGNGGKP